MKTLILTTLFAAALFAACGRSEKENTAILASQKARADSSRVAEVRAMKNEEAYKVSLRDSLNYYTSLLPRQQKALAQLRVHLSGAVDQPTPTEAFDLSNLQLAVQHSVDRVAQLKRQLGQ